MKFLSHLTGLFKASVPSSHQEIEQHLHRLNVLLLAYQHVKTLTVADWSATEREIEMELQWLDIHRLKLTSTSYPLLPTAVHSADAIGLKS